MPRLSRIQENTKRRIADLSARDLAPEALSSKVLSTLQDAIPFDGGHLFGIDPMIGVALHTTLARERAIVDVSPDTLEAVGIVMLNPDAGIRFSTPAGEAWGRLV